MNSSRAIAQTNIQLLNQLRESGWDLADLRLVSDAYDLCMRLHSGRFRGDGRPFPMHCVGTASIAAHLGQPPPAVAAAVLHAAYAQGDFGDAIEGMTAAKRERIRGAVGSETEELVAAYTELDWDPKRISESAGDFEGDPREVVYLRLANELDDRIDLGLAYSGKTGATRRAASCSRASSVWYGWRTSSSAGVTQRSRRGPSSPR